MEALLAAAFVLLGLSVGSFLNVCIDRLPQNGSIIKPPSHCETCRRQLTAKDLVPILSYLWLKGRCRYCHASIPRRSLWVELATGIMFAFLYWYCGLNAQLGVIAFYACLFIIIFVIDLENGLILNKVVYPGMVMALLLAALVPQPWLTRWAFHGIANAALGGGIGFAMFFLLAVLSRGGMGWGDVKLAFLAGLATGFPLMLAAAVMGAILGGAVAITLLIAKKRKRRETIPFGPFLSLATLITLLWGSDILIWYIGLM